LEATFIFKRVNKGLGGGGITFIQKLMQCTWAFLLHTLHYDSLGQRLCTTINQRFSPITPVDMEKYMSNETQDLLLSLNQKQAQHKGVY
jgi:hypothetical protein